MNFFQRLYFSYLQIAKREKNHNEARILKRDSDNLLPFDLDSLALCLQSNFA